MLGGPHPILPTYAVTELWYPPSPTCHIGFLPLGSLDLVWLGGIILKEEDVLSVVTGAVFMVWESASWSWFGFEVLLVPSLVPLTVHTLTYYGAYSGSMFLRWWVYVSGSASYGDTY